MAAMCDGGAAAATKKVKTSQGCLAANSRSSSSF
jgi:hypothetical protein